MDYAQARDDLYEWECRQRALQREQRHRERMEQERMRPPSPPPVVHYTDHEAVAISEKIKGWDLFKFRVEFSLKEALKFYEKCLSIFQYDCQCVMFA